MKMASFENFKSDLNQTWFIDIIWKLSYVHAVTKVTNRDQRSSEVSL